MNKRFLEHGLGTFLTFLGFLITTNAHAHIAVDHFERYRIAGAVESVFEENFFAGCEIQAKNSENGLQVIVRVDNCKNPSKEKNLTFNFENAFRDPSGWGNQFAATYQGRKIILLTSAGVDSLAFYDGSTGTQYSEMQRAILYKIGR